MLGRALLAATLALNRRGLYLGRRSGRLHSWIYRRTGGRVGGRMPGFAAAGIVLVDHVGARSGVPRRSPMMFLRDGPTIVVVAAKAGQASHPAWFHNLLAHPETTVQLGARTLAVRARVADPQERERLWPQLVALFPGFAEYARQAAPRQLPVVLLEPRDEQP